MHNFIQNSWIYSALNTENILIIAVHTLQQLFILSNFYSGYDKLILMR